MIKQDFEYSVNIGDFKYQFSFYSVTKDEYNEPVCDTLKFITRGYLIQDQPKSDTEQSTQTIYQIVIRKQPVSINDCIIDNYNNKYSINSITEGLQFVSLDVSLNQD